MTIVRNTTTPKTTIVAAMKATHTEAEMRAPVDFETVCELLDDLLEAMKVERLVTIIERQARIIEGQGARIELLEREAGYKAVSIDFDTKKVTVRPIDKRAA